MERNPTIKIVLDTSEKKDLRSPLAKARDEWFASEEGQKCCDISLIRYYEVKEAPRYLHNRLAAAFLAGAAAQEKIAAAVPTPKIGRTFDIIVDREGGKYIANTLHSKIKATSICGAQEAIRLLVCKIGIKGMYRAYQSPNKEARATSVKYIIEEVLG
jgi:hypothetical protein